MSDVEVTFSPSGRRGRVPVGTTVLDAARTLGVDLDSVCGGRGICGRCQISVGSSPTLDGDPGRLSEWSTVEDDYRTRRRARRPLEPPRRLGCNATVLRDVVIDVPPESQVHRQVVRKALTTTEIEIDPTIALRYVEVTEPDLESPTGDLERMISALADQWDLHDLTAEVSVVGDIQAALREGKWKVTAAIRDGHRIVGVWPGLRDTVYGVAFDVGSTTIAGHLCELGSGRLEASTGRMNPQIAYGEDLMSRVSYILMNSDGVEKLVSAVQTALDGLVGELCAAAGIERDDIFELTIVGNPIMHHLVHGIDPRELGTAPFALATTEPLESRASELGIGAAPTARVYALPCIAGHVGADAAAVALADGPHRREAVSLVVDVGTNAEILLGSSERLLAASSPTGPAFEGAQISAGQRAAPGAVERVRIDRETLEPRIKVIGCDRWSDETGFETPAAGVTGICGSGIIEALAELFLAGVIATDGTIVDDTRSSRIEADGRTRSYRLWDDPVIRITQNDVRAIQLAKAALHAGCRLLMDRLGIEEVDRVVLAGAFGSHIDPVYALILGLVPDAHPGTVSSAGNAAGTGAVMALLSAAARREIEELSRRIEKVETATEAAFQDHFVGAMGIPHRTDPYTRLGTAVDLPAPSETPTRHRRRRKDST